MQRNSHFRWQWATAALLALLTACSDLAIDPGARVKDQGATAAHTGAPRPVTDQRLVAAADEPHNWLNHGRTWDEQRFSTLDNINRDNIGRLKLAWHLDRSIGDPTCLRNHSNNLNGLLIAWVRNYFLLNLFFIT